MPSFQHDFVVNVQRVGFTSCELRWALKVESNKTLARLFCKGCQPSSRSTTTNGKVTVERHRFKAASWSVQLFGIDFVFGFHILAYCLFTLHVGNWQHRRTMNTKLFFGILFCMCEPLKPKQKHDKLTTRGLANQSDVMVTTFVCDSATANLLMVSLVGQSAPTNVLAGDSKFLI